MKTKTTLRSRIGLSLVLALAIGALALPAASIAQSTSSPTDAVYGDDCVGGGGSDPSGGTGGSENCGGSASFQSSGGSSSGGTSGSGLSSQIGSLPFTGMDLIILAGVALVLTGTGFALRRASMPRTPQA